MDSGLSIWLVTINTVGLGMTNVKVTVRQILSKMACIGSKLEQLVNTWSNLAPSLDFSNSQRNVWRFRQHQICECNYLVW